MYRKANQTPEQTAVLSKMKRHRAVERRRHQAYRDAVERRNELIREARKEGIDLGTLATLWGVNRARISQIEHTS